MARQRDTKPESHVAPEPEGPEEVYRRFERLNRQGPLGSLRGLAGGLGRKSLYGALAVVEVVAIVLGVFFEVPFMDVLALGLPGLFAMLLGNSKDEPGDETREETFFEKLLGRLGGPDSAGSNSRSGGR